MEVSEVTTFVPQDTTQADVRSANENKTFQRCSQGIPGIVSYETSMGLSNFSSSYGDIHGYIAVAVCLFGVLSNTAIIIVLTRKNMITSTNTILLWLAVSDLLTMLSYLPFAIHFYIIERDLSREPFSSPEFPWVCFLLFHASFSIVCHSIAIWLTIALAIFRYIYICKPTKGAFYCSQQRARLVIALIIFLTMAICIPNGFVNTYKSNYENRTHSFSNGSISRWNRSESNTTITMSIITPYYYPSLRESTTFETTAIQVNNWIQAILIKLVPCGMLTTLTLLLVHAMHKAYRKRLKLKSQGKKAESEKHGEHNRITGMLLAVVVLFTLTELPQGILTLMNIFIECFYEVVYYKLGDLLDIMALINNSVNFVLYCTMSTQFRNTFSSIFCPTRPSGPKWLNMRIVTSRRDKNSIEASTKDSQNNKKGRQLNNKKVNPGNVEGDAHVDKDAGNCNLVANDCHDASSSVNSKADSERLLITQEPNDGSISHTHGISSDQTHV